MTLCLEHKQAGTYGIAAYKGGTIGSHVKALIEATGTRPVGMIALHSCDNPRCINPAHLRWGTHQENTADMVQRGRHRKISPSLHTLTEEQVRYARQAVAAGASLSGVGKYLHVNHKTVDKIIKGLTYQHVT